MTLEQVREKLEPKKPISLVQVRRYVRRLKIRPIGRLRTRPQHYPDNTADVILQNLGLSLVTMNTLRSVRAKAQKARAA